VNFDTDAFPDDAAGAVDVVEDSAPFVSGADFDFELQEIVKTNAAMTDQRMARLY
jgi:hypothetical protein